VHAPETFRLVCLQLLIPEQEERSFGDLRNISLRTVNRQCGEVIDNAVLRYNAQQDENRIDYIRQQESIISHQAKYLQKLGNTHFERPDQHYFRHIVNALRISCFLERTLGGHCVMME
jgi:hypothetical protein